MSIMEKGNEIGPAAGDRILGYRVNRVEPLEGIDALIYDLEHLPTGARHLHIANSDEENTFSVAFKTVPTDSTGVGARMAGDWRIKA